MLTGDLTTITEVEGFISQMRTSFCTYSTNYQNPKVSYKKLFFKNVLLTLFLLLTVRAIAEVVLAVGPHY